VILVTKDEAEYIFDRNQYIKITITGKGKNKRQKKRYADEMPETFALLRQYHSESGDRL